MNLQTVSISSILDLIEHLIALTQNYIIRKASFYITLKTLINPKVTRTEPTEAPSATQPATHIPPTAAAMALPLRGVAGCPVTRGKIRRGKLAQRTIGLA